jgi:alpha-L-fucosidase
MKVTHYFIVIMLSVSLNGFGQYQYPEEPEVLENLREWQDMKFGLFIHWGAYSQWGVTESWTIQPDDKGWAERPKDKTYEEYVKEYEGLQKTFNPVNFDPKKWADMAEEAGMKYVVFTTKHHDGFNMYDTKQTDYKITSTLCPFHTNPQADVTKAIFNTFRDRNFMIGAYYSIPDWHSDDCWWRYFPPKGGSLTNYDVKKYPERFARFQDFMDAQLKELSNGDYGKVDLFWFDGGGAPGIDRERFTKDIRENQPHAMVIFRGAGGLFENYTTPENIIPDKTLDYPWETCMPMGSWSYRTEPAVKPAREYIEMLLKIASRGGNLLLGVGPAPDGDWHPRIKACLKEIGAWMKVNSEAIYGTRPVVPYQETKLFFTAKGKTFYAAYPADRDETNLPSMVMVHSMQPAKGSKVHLLGYNRPLDWEKVGNGFVIRVPKSLQNKAPCQHAWVFRFEKQEESK